MAFQSFHWNNMEKPLLLQGKITMLQQLFAKVGFNMAELAVNLNLWP